ncbi:MAG: hypothetical protein HY855_17800 [Burkholderiales bacterium]|nr:hypothetical protein [Burkholderiales bacterium]
MTRLACILTCARKRFSLSAALPGIAYWSVCLSFLLGSVKLLFTDKPTLIHVLIWGLLAPSLLSILSRVILSRHKDSSAPQNTADVEAEAGGAIDQYWDDDLEAAARLDTFWSIASWGFRGNHGTADTEADGNTPVAHLVHAELDRLSGESDSAHWIASGRAEILEKSLTYIDNDAERELFLEIKLLLNVELAIARQSMIEFGVITGTTVHDFSYVYENVLNLIALATWPYSKDEALARRQEEGEPSELVNEDDEASLKQWWYNNKIGHIRSAKGVLRALTASLEYSSAWKLRYDAERRLKSLRRAVKLGFDANKKTWITRMEAELNESIDRVSALSKKGDLVQPHYSQLGDLIGALSNRAVGPSRRRWRLRSPLFRENQAHELTDRELADMQVREQPGDMQEEWRKAFDTVMCSPGLERCGLQDFAEGMLAFREAKESLQGVWEEVRVGTPKEEPYDFSTVVAGVAITFFTVCSILQWFVVALISLCLMLLVGVAGGLIVRKRWPQLDGAGDPSLPRGRGSRRASPPL